MGTPGLRVHTGISHNGGNSNWVDLASQQGQLTLAHALEQAQWEQRESTMWIQQLKEEARQTQTALEQSKQKVASKGKKRASSRPELERVSPTEDTPEQTQKVTQEWSDTLLQILEEDCKEVIALFAQ